MTGEYAVRAMLYLTAQTPGHLSLIADISRSEEVPETILRKIMAQLVKSGLVRSFRGSGGGIRLARAPEAISLLEIIETIEGRIYLNQCLIAPDFCDRISGCTVHPVWREVQDSMVNILGGKSLKDLVAADLEEA
jgi:Rrf2 family protein|tara:strand:+ start:1724 stop:2128 length:405 start_codon:yes stop_codon:yes gene_type:complete